MPEDLNAIFLDFDGTLADSLGIMRDIYERFLEGFGKKGSAAEFNSLNGPSLPEIVNILKQAHDLPDGERELLARYEKMIDADYAQAGLMPGAQEIIEWAHEKDLTVGVVTSGKAVWVNAWLKRDGLKVDFIIDRDSAPRGKPAPDPYLEALKRAGCAAAQARAVEDSATGVEAALGAGIRTFAIGVRAGNAVPVKDLRDVIRALHAA